MATQTSKGLIKPTDAEAQDIAVLNANSDRLNSFAMGTYVCTSTTRPTGANLWQGQLIFETDTGSVYIWDGTTWNTVAADTGWVTITVASGFTASPPIQVRKLNNNQVVYRGRLNRTAGNFLVGNSYAFTAVGAVPAAFYTSASFTYNTFMAFDGAGNTGFVNCDAVGTLNLAVSFATNNMFINGQGYSI